jgi:hypothetical protein
MSNNDCNLSLTPAADLIAAGHHPDAVRWALHAIKQQDASAPYTGSGECWTASDRVRDLLTNDALDCVLIAIEDALNPRFRPGQLRGPEGRVWPAKAER